MEASPLNDRAEHELVIGYAPTFDHVEDWQKVFRQEHLDDDSVVRRVIWEQASNRHRRLLVDVAESPTPERARSRLAAIKDDSNVPLVEGPSRLGRGALVNAKRVPGSDEPRLVEPRSVHFSRANLAIWVLSCGPENFDVLACADRIAADLDSPAPLDIDEDLVLKRQSDRPESPEAIFLSVEPQWERGEWAWYRFMAHGGTLTRTADDDRLVLRLAVTDQAVTVNGLALEPGRKAYSGQFSHTA